MWLRESTSTTRQDVCPFRRKRSCRSELCSSQTDVLLAGHKQLDLFDQIGGLRSTATALSRIAEGQVITIFSEEEFSILRRSLSLRLLYIQRYVAFYIKLFLKFHWRWFVPLTQEFFIISMMESIRERRWIDGMKIWVPTVTSMPK